MNRQLIDWNDDNIAKLKALWKSGDSAALIAEKLGSETGRLAVIGKAKRLNLGPHPFSTHKAKASADNHKRQVRKTVKRMERNGSLSRYKIDGPIRHKKPPKPPVIIEKVVERKPGAEGPVFPADYRFMRSTAWEALEGSNPKRLEDLARRGECKWPLGSVPYLFCAIKTENGARYCATHSYLSHPRT